MLNFIQYFKRVILWYVVTGLIYDLALLFYYFVILDYVDVYPTLAVYVAIFYFWPFFGFYATLSQVMTRPYEFIQIFFLLIPFVSLVVIYSVYKGFGYYRKGHSHQIIT
ncbi:MAG: hypothetical protein ACTSW1_14665 [Candidatus Hodarchaeales archaeon]